MKNQFFSEKQVEYVDLYESVLKKKKMITHKECIKQNFLVPLKIAFKII